MKSLDAFRTIIFDCDGVILNSNEVKTAAFYKATLPYGKDAAAKMVNYHVSHGGISRYLKFSHFLKFIAPGELIEDYDKALFSLLNSYADNVAEGLLACDITKDLEYLKKITTDKNWLVVSGGDQKELNEVFYKRDLVKLFPQGIYGSPDVKSEILSREIENGNIVFPAVFLGDSKYDYQVAKQAGIDFIFLTEWSEVENWSIWVSENKIDHVKSISSLI